MSRPALFLDRDGVINIDRGYVYRQEDIEFVDGIFEIVRAAKGAGFLVVVVTNQAGIGRGYYTEHDFHRLMDWMRGRFCAQGGQLDAVYFCPFHPEFGLGEYRRESDCRKPAPGMLLKAQRDLGIDMARSILVGDKPTDVAAGLAAEVGTNLQLVETDVKPGGNFRLICHLADVFVHLESSVSGLAVNSIDPHG